MIGGNITSTQSTNTPSIIAGDGATAITILVANPARVSFTVQNVGTTAASVRLGAGASASVYHFALKGGSGDNDGLGGSIVFSGPTVYNGIVTFFGASTAKVVAYEAAP